MYREKKEIRFNTDYGESQMFQIGNISNYTKFQKKIIPAKRRDTFDCSLMEDPVKKLGVHSTKYSANKNIEIKNLFKGRD